MLNKKFNLYVSLGRVVAIYLCSACILLFSNSCNTVVGGERATPEGELILGLESHRSIDELIEIIEKFNPELTDFDGGNFIHIAAEKNHPSAGGFVYR